MLDQDHQPIRCYPSILQSAFGIQQNQEIGNHWVLPWCWDEDEYAKLWKVVKVNGSTGLLLGRKGCWVMLGLKHKWNFTTITPKKTFNSNHHPKLIRPADKSQIKMILFCFFEFCVLFPVGYRYMQQTVALTVLRRG